MKYFFLSSHLILAFVIHLRLDPAALCWYRKIRAKWENVYQSHSPAVASHTKSSTGDHWKMYYFCIFSHKILYLIVISHWTNEKKTQFFNKAKTVIVGICVLFFPFWKHRSKWPTLNLSRSFQIFHCEKAKCHCNENRCYLKTTVVLDFDAHRKSSCHRGCWIDLVHSSHSPASNNLFEEAHFQREIIHYGTLQT